ncbi:MAG: DUF4434 domain-containing protein [Promethearchaeota archaeon]
MIKHIRSSGSIRVILLATFIITVMGTNFAMFIVVERKRNDFLRYHEIPAENKTEPLITGSFLQYTSLNSWNYTTWNEEFKNLKMIGIDTIILQWVHDAKVNKTLYCSNIFDLNFEGISVNMTVPENNSLNPPSEPDVVSVLLYLGEIHDINIIIGLSANWEFWKYIENDTWIQNELRLNGMLVKELLQKFGSISSFKGFYIPYEIHQGSTPSGVDGEKYGRFIGNLCSRIRQETDAAMGVNASYNKTISIAPFVSPVASIPDAIAFWDEFLSLASIDILMIQDGIGVGRLDLYSDIPVIYTIVGDCCEKHHVKFWTDLEIFKMTGEQDSTSFRPAEFQTVQSQLKLESRYVEKIVVFDIPHYMSLQFSNPASILYRNYSNYLENYKQGI